MKEENSPVEPRQKNKISNFGTSFLYTQILFTTLSLSIWRRIKAKKRHLYSWTIQLYVLKLRTYIYITVVKNLCIFILPCGLCCYFMLSFQLLFAILLRTVLLIPKISHGKTGVADYNNINIITTKTYRLVIFHYLGERRKRPGGCVIVWNLEALASGGQSGPKLFPHVICQFLYAWEKNSEQDLFL